MILSLNFINKIEKNDFSVVKKYLEIKCKSSNNLSEEKIQEIKDVKNLIEKSSNKIKNIDIKNIAFSIKIFKHEHDALLFFKKNNKYIILDIEIKKNSSKQKINDQIKKHLTSLSNGLEAKKYKLYGISFVIDKNQESIFEVIHSRNKGFKIINKRKDFFSLLKKIVDYNFIYINDPLSVIKYMEGDINQIITICKEKAIELTSDENKLIKWILKNYLSEDILVINANGGAGKTTILLKLFFNELSKKSCVLFNNYRIRSQISKEFSSEYNDEYFFYIPDHCTNVQNKEILLIDEAQRLTTQQIRDLKQNFKKLILFGDKYQVFDKKYDCDYESIHKVLENEYNYKCLRKEYESDTKRRCSKNFLSFIKAMLNKNKYELPDDCSYLEEKIFIYDEISDFLFKFDLIEKNKKMFSQIEHQTDVCSIHEFKKRDFMELQGKSNPNFAFNDDYKKIGTAYNAFSFEIDFVFVIINDNKETIKKDKYIFNEIYTLFSRTRKELHILFLNDDLSHYCETYDLLEEFK